MPAPDCAVAATSSTSSSPNSGASRLRSWRSSCSDWRTSRSEVVVEAVPGDDEGLRWRTRTEFAVGPDGRAGMRRHRSHDLIPIDDCLIASERVVGTGVLQGHWAGEKAVDVVAPSEGAAVVVRIPSDEAVAPVVTENVAAQSLCPRLRCQCARLLAGPPRRGRDLRRRGRRRTAARSRASAASTCMPVSGSSRPLSRRPWGSADRSSPSSPTPPPWPRPGSTSS